MYQNLFVAKLPRNVVDADLMRIFSDYEPTSSKVMLDAVSGKSKGFGFVLFDSEEKGSSAYKALNRRGIRACGHNFTLVIYPSNHDGRVANEASNALYIRNIPLTVAQQTVEKFLHGFGDLTYCAMREDHHGSPVWVVYAEYATVAQAKKALVKIHGNNAYFPGSSPLLAKYEDSDDAKKQRRQRREVLNSINQSKEHAGLSRNFPNSYDNCNSSNYDNASFGSSAPSTAIRPAGIVFGNTATSTSNTGNDVFDPNGYANEHYRLRTSDGANNGSHGNNHTLNTSVARRVLVHDTYVPQSNSATTNVAGLAHIQIAEKMPLSVMPVRVPSLQHVNMIHTYSNVDSHGPVAFAHGGNSYASMLLDDNSGGRLVMSLAPPPYPINAPQNVVHAIPQMVATPYHHVVPHSGKITSQLGSTNYTVENGNANLLVSHAISTTTSRVYDTEPIQTTFLPSGSLDSGLARGSDVQTSSLYSNAVGSEFASFHGNTFATVYPLSRSSNLWNKYAQASLPNPVTDYPRSTTPHHENDASTLYHLMLAGQSDDAENTSFAALSGAAHPTNAHNNDTGMPEHKVVQRQPNNEVDDFNPPIATEVLDEKSSVLVMKKAFPRTVAEEFSQQDLLPMLAKLQMVVSSERDFMESSSTPVKDSFLKNSSQTNTETSMRSNSSVSRYSSTPTASVSFAHSNPIAKVLLVPRDQTLSLIS